MSDRFDKDEVRLAARANPRGLFDHLGLKVTKSSGQLEATWCPARDHKRRAMTFSPTKLLWKCHVCDTGGDVFDLVRVRQGLDFPDAVTFLAAALGVPPSTATQDERERLRAEWKRRNDEHARLEAARVAELRMTEHERSTAYWDKLQATHPAGVEYLATRGLGAAHELGVLRYDARHDGAPSLALYASDGRIKNVIHRPLVAGEKPRGMYECTTAGTLVDAVSAIAGSGAEIVIAEGFADALTAKLAWKGSFVLGAAGAGNLPKVALVAAPAVAKLKGRMRIVPHLDRDGLSKAREAVTIASEAGLSTGRGSLEIVMTRAQDLNDAWRDGWRPHA